jgi:hypothetical protein
MKRALSISAIVAGSLGWAAVTACNQTTITTPERSFDRPTDVALSCVQYFPNNITPASPHGTFNIRPLSDCETVRANELAIPVQYPLPIDFIAPLGPTNFIPFLVALVPQSARGELALVDTSQNKLVDLDPYTPDYGFLPVGKLPEQHRLVRPLARRRLDGGAPGAALLVPLARRRRRHHRRQGRHAAAAEPARAGRRRAARIGGASVVDRDGAGERLGRLAVDPRL